MEGGWIKIHRAIEEWEWYGVPEVVAIWVHILVNANMKDLKWKGMTIHRGSFVTSISQLSKETGLSVQQVRTCLDRLKSTNEITINSTNRWTVVTVCKYDDYQLCEQTHQQAIQHAIQQASNKQATTSEEGKNIYNINNTNAPAHEDWRFVSSVRRTMLGNNPDNIAEHKRELFRREVAALAQAVGMTQRQQEAFVRWWTESSPGSEKIKAEFEVAFNTEDRMKNWVERDRPRPQLQSTSPKSRMDTLEDDMNFIHDFFNGQRHTNTAPDEQ